MLPVPAFPPRRVNFWTQPEFWSRKTWSFIEKMSTSQVRPRPNWPRHKSVRVRIGRVTCAPASDLAASRVRLRPNWLRPKAYSPRRNCLHRQHPREGLSVMRLNKHVHWRQTTRGVSCKKIVSSSVPELAVFWTRGLRISSWTIVPCWKHPSSRETVCCPPVLPTLE